MSQKHICPRCGGGIPNSTYPGKFKIRDIIRITFIIFLDNRILFLVIILPNQD